MAKDETPTQALRSIRQERRAADQRVITTGMAKIALALVAGTVPDPQASLGAAAAVARHRAANDYQGDRARWSAIADLLAACAEDATVLTLARVG